jgi:hypothetical protein
MRIKTTRCFHSLNLYYVQKYLHLVRLLQLHAVEFRIRNKITKIQLNLLNLNVTLFLLSFLVHKIKEEKLHQRIKYVGYFQMI